MAGRLRASMAIPLLICDDSLMARKQVQRALPTDWEVELTLATNGREALQAIREGRGEIVFLDLTMPEIDGFQVLETIRAEQLKTIVIVISADIQPAAQERVQKLGATAFIRKPVESVQLATTLRQYGLY